MEELKKEGYRFYTIKEVLKNVETGKWVLPVWQRDYVWKKKQIISLFDSLYRGYPIGNILLWKTDYKKNTFCEFKTEAFFKGENNLTEPSDIIEENRDNEIEAVLDGQQRITSLVLSLSKKSRIRIKENDGSNGDDLHIMFNILSDLKKMKEPDMVFDLDDCEGWQYVLKNKGDKDGLFMRLDHILSDEYRTYFKSLNHIEDSTRVEYEKSLRNIKQIRNTILNLNVCIKVINNIPEESFEIFYRLNSKGSTLSSTQLSTCRLTYLDDNLKVRIHKDLRYINDNGFKFDISYIVNLLYLMANDGQLKNNQNNNDKEIVKYYDKAIEYTNRVANILIDIGLGRKVITSYNAILPITYYLYYNGKRKTTKEENDAIYYFMLLSMIKGLFGGSSRDTINRAVKAFKRKDLSVRIVEKMKDIKSNVPNNFYINQEMIEYWLSSFKKGDSTTKLLLYLLYPEYQHKPYDFHEDHMHPASEFKKGKTIFDKQDKKVQERWNKNKDLIPNLQLLDSKKNIKKNKESLKDWLVRFPKYYDNNYFPKNVKDKNGKKIDVTDLKNFDIFFNERRKLICKQLCNIFGVKYKEKK